MENKRQMERAELQLQMWDSHFRMIIEANKLVRYLFIYFFNPCYTKTSFVTTGVLSNCENVKNVQMLNSIKQHC